MFKEYNEREEAEQKALIIADVSVCFCVEDTETGMYESIHLNRENAEKEIEDWKRFKPSKSVKIVEREIT